MQKNIKFAIEAFVVFTYVLAVVVLLLSILPILASEAAAAWAQAIFSVLAILGAIYISRREAREATLFEANSKRVAATEKFLTVLALLNEVASIAQTTIDELDSMADLTIGYFDPDPLENCRIALSSLPLFDMPNHTLVIETITIVRWLQFHQADFHHLIKMIQQSAEVEREAETYDEVEEKMYFEISGDLDLFRSAYDYAIRHAKNRMTGLLNVVSTAIDKVRRAEASMTLA